MVYTQIAYAEDCQMFSDMHKDAYGCRPHAVATPSFEDMPAAMAAIQRRIELEIKYDRIREISAQYNFERSIEYVMRREGYDRLGATRFIVNRAANPHDCHSHTIDHDFESVCYDLGISYRLAGQIELQYKGNLNG